MRTMLIIAVVSAALIALSCGCSRTERTLAAKRECACEVEFWPAGTDRIGPSETFYTEEVKFEGDRTVFIDAVTGRTVSLPSFGSVVKMHTEHSSK